MPKYFKSLKFKLISLVLMGMVSLVMGLFFYVLPVYEDHLFEKRKEQVKSAVEVAFGTLDTVQANVAAGRIPKENTAKEVQKIFEALRYSKTEYFFAYDKKGINTAHGTKLSAVGKNRYEDKDPNGFYYIQAFLSHMDKEEGGYVYYQFDDGKGGKPQDKVSFIKYYKPLDWVVGSGVTIKGVQDEMAAIRLKVLIGVGIITLVAFAVSWMYSNRICNQIDQISHDLFNEADKVAGVALNISKASEILSSSTTQQASALQETSSSIEETSAMITKNADNAKASMTISLKSQSSVEQGKKYVNEMIFSIQEISDSNVEMVKQIDESNKEIAEIVKVINEIGNKTKVINDIVFQTKLLSFNASVEAARAGEHGKGFAVVAEEIGNLAQMSGNSAKEISELLDNSIHTVQKTIDNSKERITRIVASGETKVKNSGSIAKRCEEIFDEIVLNVNQVNEMVGEIAVASNEQATGVREINSAVTELDSAGQQNSVMSQKTSEYAGELRDQVVELRKNTSALTVLIKGEDDQNVA